MKSKIVGKHLNGYKHLSLNSPIENYFDTEFVYFPIKVDNAEYKLLVNVGDKVKLGQPILERVGRFVYPVCSSVSGEVTASGKKMWHSSGKMVEMLEIKNDHQDELYYEVKSNLDKLLEEQLELIKQSGIVGLGGAGFPTFVKYSTNPDNKADVILVNAAECEPYITCDYMSIIEDSEKLIRGLSYIMKLNHADKGYVCIKETKVPAIEALHQAIDKLQIKGIDVFLLKDTYPAGWEKYIVEHVVGKTYNMLPKEVGAIVNNVQTVMAVADVLENNQPLTKRVVTITGDGITNPKNYRVRIGQSVNELFKLSGGFVSDLTDAYFICGGPMTGKAMFFDELVITPNVGSCIINHKKNVLKLECIGCGKCSEKCPTFLTPTEIRQAYLDKDVNLLKKLNVTKCVQCGLCSYVCPSRVEMTDFMFKAKDLVLKSNKR